MLDHHIRVRDKRSEARLIIPDQEFEGDCDYIEQ